ncbi:hypothetical protein HRbin40_02270 [bacterium HR40]|nr:hypothetical protein HRbin40_02270 [bacterium HR40]
MIRIKRVHDRPEPADGVRVLVDGVWPRGIGKGEAAIDLWLREIAPSTELRRWFAHEPQRFEEFYRRYSAELDERPAAVRRLLDLVRKGDVTLLFAARDREHNNAVALLRYLRERGLAA